MRGADISVIWYPAVSEIRTYHFRDGDINAILRVNVEKLTTQMDAISGVKTSDVVADSNLLVITATKDRSWEEIEKDLAGILEHTLKVTPHFIFRNH